MWAGQTGRLKRCGQSVNFAVDELFVGVVNLFDRVNQLYVNVAFSVL